MEEDNPPIDKIFPIERRIRVKTKYSTEVGPHLSGTFTLPEKVDHTVTFRYKRTASTFGHNINAVLVEISIYLDGITPEFETEN